VRRGFNWSVIVDWHDEAPTDAKADDLLFSATSTNPPSGRGVFDNTVLVNVDGGCDASPTSEAPEDRNDRWLYRLWLGSCASDCSQMDGAYWSNGLGKRYTFIASNCVDNDHAFQSPIHSPDPLFVNPAVATVQCPNGYQNCEWGTLVFPFRSVGDAVKRASTMVTVLIQGGQCQVSASGRPLIVSQPMTRRVTGTGSVTLR
jgi:hypothetical protein